MVSGRVGFFGRLGNRRRRGGGGARGAAGGCWAAGGGRDGRIGLAGVVQAGAGGVGAGVVVGAAALLGPAAWAQRTNAQTQRPGSGRYVAALAVDVRGRVIGSWASGRIAKTNLGSVEGLVANVYGRVAASWAGDITGAATTTTTA